MEDLFYSHEYKINDLRVHLYCCLVKVFGIGFEKEKKKFGLRKAFKILSLRAEVR